MLGAALDVFRLRQMFGLATRARELGHDLAGDLSFLEVTRRAMLPLGERRPTRPEEETMPVFPAAPHKALAGLRGRRVALMATGGSGALASVVGAARAFEDTDIQPSVITLCTGSALFGFPFAAGRSAEEVAEFLLALDARDYTDVNWRSLASIVPRLGRGFVGIVKGDALEAALTGFLGDVRLGDLAIPAYAPIWSVERNRLDYIGPQTHPDMTVARAIRMSVSLPLFFEPVRLGDDHWSDGGIVDIFPVTPALDIEPAPDAVVAINGFYPPDFEGEDATGWERERWSILLAASQVRTCQQVQLARENLRRLRDAADVELVHPVDYDEVRGLGFYRQFLDSTDWARFMKAGRLETATALKRLDKRAQSHARRTAAA